MSESKDLLNFLKYEREELRLQRFLERKGYSNPCDDAFGLNQWTCRLIPRHSSSAGEMKGNNILQPDHLVTFLAIPGFWDQEIVDTDSNELRTWISEYKWHDIPGLNSHFLHAKVQPCSEGLFIPQLIYDSEGKGLEYFLLIRRDGNIELGLGRYVYFMSAGETIFRFISIVGRLW